MTKKLSPDIDKILSLLGRINMIQNHAAAQVVRVLPHGLTLAQFSIMHYLHNRTQVTPVEVATNFLLSKPSIGEALDKLAQKEFVVIAKNEQDRRSKIVSLAPLGRAAHGEALLALQPFLLEMRKAVGMKTIEMAFDTITPIRDWFKHQR